MKAKTISSKERIIKGEIKINIDCIYYSGNKPCRFHKQDGRLCKNCPDYQKIVKRILIVKLDALGDVLRTTSILTPLAEKFPNAEIVWLTRENALELIDNNPYIRRKFAVEENYLEAVLNEHFDIGINLDPDFLSSTILSIADCSEKLGFLANKSGRVIPANPEAEHWYLMGLNDPLKKENRKTYQEIIYEICKITSPVRKPRIFLDEAHEIFARKFHTKNKLTYFKKIIGINTGGGKRWALKKWTLEGYIELVKLLKKADQKIGIILFGGPEEEKFNREIKKEVGGLIIDAGCSNSLLRFSALIDLVDVFCTPDSLGMHIAVALKKTTVVLVGPTSPWELDVFGNGEIVYSDKCDCIACYRPTCKKEINCMNTIEPGRVSEAIIKYL